ncbi:MULTISPECIES: IS200/IS605 family transposase [Roseivirga]|uniref:IS200/IS605 family transposase n=1 Tax=Roseivirga TaxID=290180 RepID=UPI001B0F81B4|nr:MULTISPECIES: IS200/IS605 family transposase [Roseivirga]MBO6662150.1 IS200/IS605 family transposase [Roseivirga sp.]MBO6763106.1 IS200/IS605 family transposase [Roseivirga sp.]MBO6910122.1 IS200/IS605 family transposase [Roseivirga sp.]WPZ08998.1 IS200/IS605 family transposase [Roseivirga spongicola]
MANTYTQVHIQVVFAVKNRSSLIHATWEDALFRYITGIIQNHGHRVLQVNGMPDHVHILFGMKPDQALSDLIKQVKQDSSKWINQQGYVQGKFSWQAGYGAFSYSKSQIPRVVRYIQNQKEHHKKKTFREEYLEFLKTFEIDFNEGYIFKEV